MWITFNLFLTRKKRPRRNVETVSKIILMAGKSKTFVFPHHQLGFDLLHRFQGHRNND
jgi:hypothetical protein